MSVATEAQQLVSLREEDKLNTEPSMSSKSIVGLITPPPDIRAIVDKTAQFVARNGIEFENRIKEKEINNVRFSFLSPTDPYHAYYRAKVTEFETGVSSEIPIPKPQLPEAVREHVQQAEFVPTVPPPAFEYNADPSTINAFDLDLMRLTAMFVARNGRQFLTQLMNREIRNFQFDFLKPQHSNFLYFTKLVEQYTKVIIPPKTVVDDLSKSLEYDLIMGDIRYRVAWERHQRVVKDREDKAIQKERMAYNAIDWHDFVVVQTVDFQPSETLNLPPLCTKKDVGSRILMQQRTEAAKAAAEEMEMESDSDDEEKEAQEARKEEQRPTYEVTQPTPAPPQAGALVRDYDPKKARQQTAKKPLPDKYIISPLTNERISATQLQDHMRYNTVDSQYRDQRDRDHADRQEDDALMNSSGTEISRNIAKLAERRSDIFGVGVQGGEQTTIGKKLGEEEQRPAPPRPDPRTIWENQQSMDAATRFAQEQAHQAQKAHQERFIAAAREAAQSLATSLMMPPPTSVIIPGSIQTHPMPMLGGALMTSGVSISQQSIDSMAASFMTPAGSYDQQFSGFNEPAAKRARLEDNLEPEEVWMEQIKGPINLMVTAPVSTEWNLDGQTFNVSVDIKSTVGDLKTQIQNQTTVPSSKQKLVFEGMFLKDTNTLAFYNMQSGNTVQLQFKERGGRKK